MNNPVWLPVLGLLPVLLFGEWLVRRVSWLGKFSIPAPVIGGLFVAVLVLILNVTGWSTIQLSSSVTTPWWTWLVSTEPEWITRPSKGLSVPFMVAFYTCIGLSASWEIVRRGSVVLMLFLAASAMLGVVQNLVGAGAATAIGSPALMGLLCGSITMVGGHATALGFAPQLEEAGLSGAAAMGAAAATLGLLAGGLLGGPVGTWLIRRHQLKSSSTIEETVSETQHATGILHELRTLGKMGGTAVKHLLLVIACMKAGTWLSWWLQQSGMTFPMHIGAMMVGIVLRNLHDLLRLQWVRSDVIATLGSVMLVAFLGFAMMGLHLIDLAHTALPMLIILAVEVVVTILFAILICWPFMGRDYDAAVMTAGLCGCGIGNTANAIASMKSLVEKHGPAPKTFLVVSLVGTLLGDLTNALNITFFLNLLK